MVKMKNKINKMALRVRVALFNRKAEGYVDTGLKILISVDNIDTIDEINDIAPFHNVINELYPKQVSKKVRQVKRSCAEQGKFMGSQAAYGYKKSPQDKHNLVINEEVAPIVQRIFHEFANGYSARMIADQLNNENIDCPKFYNLKKDNRVPKPGDRNNWGSATILRILRSEVYIGSLVQGTREKVSYKNKKMRPIDPKDWIIRKGVHEPLIDMALWKRVQDNMPKRSRKRTKSKLELLGLFSGILICADCGNILALQQRQKTSYRCNRYNNSGKNACSTHYIDEEVLTKFVLNDIRTHAKLALNQKEELARRLMYSTKTTSNSKEKFIMADIKEIEKRQSTIKFTLKNLYEYKCTGKIKEYIFYNFICEYMEEQKELEKKLKSLQQELNKINETKKHVNDWLSLIGKYTELNHLDRNIVSNLIERIIIHERVKTDGKQMQQIEIEYRFIGNLLQNMKEDIA